MTSGALFFQGDADYTIQGGILTGSSTQNRLVISQMTTAANLTISASVEDNGGNLLIQKMGFGKLILSGALNNTGGISVANGTLQLQGIATGSTGALTTSDTGATHVPVGDGQSDFTLGLRVRNGTTSTITVNPNASFVDAGTKAGNNVIRN